MPHRIYAYIYIYTRRIHRSSRQNFRKAISGIKRLNQIYVKFQVKKLLWKEQNGCNKFINKALTRNNKKQARKVWKKSNKPWRQFICSLNLQLTIVSTYVRKGQLSSFLKTMRQIVCTKPNAVDLWPPIILINWVYKIIFEFFYSYNICSG